MYWEMTFRLAAPSIGHLNEGELPCSFLRCHWTKIAWTRIKSYLCESITEDSWYYPFNFYQFSLLLILWFSLLHHTVDLLHNLFLYHCWCLFCVLLFEFLDEKDYVEIADILKKPVSTVGNLILRGKKLFKQEYEKLIGSC